MSKSRKHAKPVGYFLIGENGTNIIKKRGAELWCLMGPAGPECHWENRPSLIRYFMGGKECEPIDEAKARLKYAEITGGQAWAD